MIIHITVSTTTTTNNNYSCNRSSNNDNDNNHNNNNDNHRQPSSQTNDARPGSGACRKLAASATSHGRGSELLDSGGFNTI